MTQKCSGAAPAKDEISHIVKEKSSGTCSGKDSIRLPDLASQREGNRRLHETGQRAQYERIQGLIGTSVDAEYDSTLYYQK